jgi:cytochrome c-type biogenesis protein CcmH
LFWSFLLHKREPDFSGAIVKHLLPLTLSRQWLPLDGIAWFKIFLLILLAVFFTVGSPLHLLGQIVTPEVRKVSERFVCQCGCNHQLSACAMLNCGSATPLRAEIATLLQEGKAEEQIVALFAAKYGKRILSAPTTKGLDLTAWMMPFLMLLAGLFVVAIIIHYWLRRRAVTSNTAGFPSPVPDEYRERMEKELKDL